MIDNKPNVSNVTVEALNRLYNERRMTLGEIAEIYGVSGEAIRYRMKRLGLPRRGKPWSSKEAREKIDCTELQRLYIQEQLSMREVARQFGVSETIIHSRLKEFGIERRDLSSARIDYPRKDFSGDLSEKAYLIGFRKGDLWVGKTNSGPISASI